MDSSCPPPLFATIESLRMVKPGQAALRGFICRTFLMYWHSHLNPYLRNPVYTVSVTLSTQTTGHDEDLKRGLAGYPKPPTQTERTDKQKKWGWTKANILLTIGGNLVKFKLEFEGRCSSDGQSMRLISAVSGVQIPAPPPFLSDWAASFAAPASF